MRAGQPRVKMSTKVVQEFGNKTKRKGSKHTEPVTSTVRRSAKSPWRKVRKNDLIMMSEGKETDCT